MKNKKNSLLIYKTKKGYYYNAETKKREPEAVYRLQFFKGRRLRKEAVKKGIETYKEGNKNFAKEVAIDLSEQARKRQNEKIELYKESKREDFFWNLDSGNKGFKKGKIKIITPKGGTISTKNNGAENTAAAFEDLKSILGEMAREQKTKGKKGAFYLFTIPIYTDPETGEIVYDFSAVNFSGELSEEDEEKEENAGDELQEAMQAELIAGWDLRNG